MVERTLKETFAIKSGGDNEGEIKRIFNNIKNATLTTDNFKEHIAQSNNVLQIIDAQLENEFSLYLDTEDEWNRLGKQERIKKAMENKIMPLEAFQARIAMAKRERQIISWHALAYDIAKSMMRKLAQTLDEVKAYEVKRDALREMKDMEKERSALFLDIMTSRMNAMDEKFMAGLKALQEENRIDRKENTQMMSGMMVNGLSVQKDTVQLLFELISRSYPEQFEEIANLKKDFDSTHTEYKSEALEKLRNKAIPIPVAEKLKDIKPPRRPELPKFEDVDNEPQDLDAAISQQPDTPPEDDTVFDM